METTNIYKLIGAFLLWLCMIIFGFLPLKLKDFRTNKTLLSLSNCFSGGLFIAIGLIHVLPEAHENLEGQKEKEGEEAFPLSFVICLASFSFILFIDKVIFNNEDLAEIDGNKPLDLTKSRLNNNPGEDVHDNFKELVSSKYKVALKLSALEKIKSNEEIDDHYLRIGDEEEEVREEKDEEAEPVRNNSNSNSKRYHNIYDDEEKETIVKFVEPEGEKKEEKKNKDSHGHSHSHHGHQHRAVTAKDSFLTAYILLMAMGIHGFFAGLAFGIAKTKGETINMFIAMISHKWSEALTVGISFVSAGINYNRCFWMIIFLSFITPLGVLLGYFLSSMSDKVVGVALAISAGTFIYISCAEIIIEEFSIAKNKYIKFFFYVVGIVFIVFVGMLE